MSKKSKKLPDSKKKKILLKDLQKQFPEAKKSELELILLDLKRIPLLFQKLITETQVNLKVYDRYKNKKKIRTDYELEMSNIVKTSDGQSRKE